MTPRKSSQATLDTGTADRSDNDERLEQLLGGLKAVRDGDLSKRLPQVGNALLDEISTVFNGMVDELDLASKYKSEFLTNMSHELRTPLTSLLLLAGVLAQNKTQNLTGQQVELAKTIQSAGSDLLLLINDILDLSKAEAGKMDRHPEEVRLSRLLEYVEATFRPLTEEKGLELAITVEPDVPDELCTDEQRLRQVLRNLLSNAVKFTERGRVELRVQRADREEGVEPHLAFSVVDTGIGIAEDNLERIFGAFQQADATTSRRYGGTGLGLSISRQVVNLLGGDIRAESELGKGSTFTLQVPVTLDVGGVGPGHPQFPVVHVDDESESRGSKQANASQVADRRGRGGRRDARRRLWR